MGQPIELRDTTVIGDVALFDTDRTISGQDGESFRSEASAREGTTFSARLAQRIFAADPEVTSVFVASNQVTVGRRSGWDDTTTIGGVIERFFLYY